ncbi:MAG: phosphotransacetylase [Clostridia bacterium]|nr:phosphotransacetylase [Clostridia bacterium]
MDIISRLYNKAKTKKGRILLPEAILDERVMNVCCKLVADNMCELVLLGKKEQYPAELKNNPLVTIVNPSVYTRREEMIKLFMQKRKKYKLTREQAIETLQDPRYFATMLLEMREAEGMVLGAYYTSADALRPALQIIKGKEGQCVVGSMLINRDDFVEPNLYLDVSLNENPDEQQLAEIGVAGANFYREVLNREPKVAFLSYSTYGSAGGELVSKVRNATELAKKLGPDYIIEGEMQFDAAVVPEVAQTKCPASFIKGKANVFVFPDLNCGNIAYKIAQRIGGCQAVGPIMLNFRYPVNDLSRGCSVKDIYDTVVITKLQIEEGEN